MPVEALQTVDACIGIFTAAVKLSQFVVRYKHAGEIGEQTVQTAEQVQRLLRRIRRSLRMLQSKSLPSQHPMKSEEEQAVADIKLATEACERTLRAGLRDVFGEDAVDFESRSIRRAHIAFHPERVDSLRQQLSFDLQILTGHFQYLVLYVHQPLLDPPYLD